MSYSNKSPVPVTFLSHAYDPGGHNAPEATASENEPRYLSKVGQRRGRLPPRLPLEPHTSTEAESLNTIPSSNASVWTKYVQKHQLELNGLVDIAKGKEPLGNRVLVRQTSNQRLDGKLRTLAQFRRQPYFVQTFEVFLSGTMVDVVCEYVDLTLLHILGCPRFPTEEEVAAIAGQGSNL